MTEQQTKDMGIRIKLFRLSQEQTQEEMAEKIGLSPKSLGAVERGERSLSMSTLLALHENCSCDINYILSGKSDGLSTPLIKLIEKLGTHKAQYIDEIAEVVLRAISD